MLREIFLQQSAYNKVDTYSDMKRQHSLLRAIRTFSDMAARCISLGASVADIAEFRSGTMLSKSKYEEKFDEELGKALETMAEEFRGLEARL